MELLVKMAWRNLLRRKRRTLITATAVAFGVLLAVSFTALGDYTYTNMINTSAKMGFGHITVQPEGYIDAPSLKLRVSRSGEIREKILAVEGVDAAITRITGAAMFASAVKNTSGMFIAVSPEMEISGGNIFLSSIKEGRLFEGADGQGALVGVKMAEKLNLKLGKKLVWTVTDKSGEIVSELARVSGIFKTGVEEVDGSVVILPIDRVRKTLGYSADEATNIAVMIGDQRQSEIMAKKIRQTLAGEKNIETLTWKTTQPDMAGYVTVDKSSNIIFQLLVGLLIAAGILDTMLMGVMERVREFGVMMAIGMNPWRLSFLVMVESIFLGLLGLALGVIITTPWFYYMYYTGIDLSGAIENTADISGVIVDPVLKFRLFKESAFAILAGVFTLTVVAGLYPSFKAGRVPPVQSLKNI